VLINGGQLELITTISTTNKPEIFSPTVERRNKE